LIEIINKPLLLHLVGYLYYWQMGFNSVFKGLTWATIISFQNTFIFVVSYVHVVDVQSIFKQHANRPVCSVSLRVMAL